MSSNRRHRDDRRDIYTQSSRREPNDTHSHHRVEDSRNYHQHYHSTPNSAQSYSQETARRRGCDSLLPPLTYSNSNYRASESSIATHSAYRHNATGQKRDRVPMGASSSNNRLSTNKARDGVCAGGIRRVEDIPKRNTYMSSKYLGRRGRVHPIRYEDSDDEYSTSNSSSDFYNENGDENDIYSSSLRMGDTNGGAVGSRQVPLALHPLRRKMGETIIKGDHGGHRMVSGRGRGRVRSDQSMSDNRGDVVMVSSRPQEESYRREQITSSKANATTQFDRMGAQLRAVKEKGVDMCISGGHEQSVLGAPAVKQWLAVLGNVDVSVREVHLQNICKHFGVELIRSSRKIVGGLIGIYYQQWTDKKRLLEKFKIQIEKHRMKKKEEKAVIVKEKALKASFSVVLDTPVLSAPISVIVPPPVIDEKKEVEKWFVECVNISDEEKGLSSSDVIDCDQKHVVDHMTTETSMVSVSSAQYLVEHFPDDDEDKMNQQEVVELEIELSTLQTMLDRKLKDTSVIELGNDQKEQMCDIAACNSSEEVKSCYCLPTRTREAAELYIQSREKASLLRYGPPLPFALSSLTASLSDTYNTIETVVLQFKSNEDLSRAVTYLNGASINGKIVSAGVMVYDSG